MKHTTSPVSLPKPFSRALPQLFDHELVEKVDNRLAKLSVTCRRSAKCKRPARCPKSAECQLSDNRQLQWHLREFILPGLAVYQVLRAEGYTQAAALARVDEVLDLVTLPRRRQMEWLGRFPLIYPLLRLYIRVAMHQYPSAGWHIDWVENSPAAIRFNMRSCFYFETLSRLGAPELTASFCRTDDVLYGHMSPDVAWQRTQTIGRGAAYCDFCFARQPAKTELAANNDKYPDSTADCDGARV